MKVISVLAVLVAMCYAQAPSVKIGDSFSSQVSAFTGGNVCFIHCATNILFLLFSSKWWRAQKKAQVIH